MICPNCLTANPENARFCMNCGSGLTADRAPSAGQALGSGLDRYIPPELLSKIESARARGAIAGERRVITILFCDIKGSTAAAEQLDPEEWTEIINNAFEHMIRPIYKYEGMVARLMGDAILAFFGAPIAHEDDPQRAVLAALDIQAGIEPYARQVQAKYNIELRLRVGLNTGLVVVGEIGSDLRLEYTATGDAINLAARMEQTAEPGTIQITEATQKLVAPFFEFEALGEAEIKGKSVPIRTFRVVAARGAPRQLRGVEGLSSPLVGRDAELAVLDERLHALQGGEGTFIAITGEAGLGKSSLVLEACRRATGGAEVHWLEGHTLSYAQSISYFAWRQVLRQSVGAADGDAPAVARRKLHEACARLDVSPERAAFLESILAVESDETLKMVSSQHGEALVQRLSDAMSEYLSACARGAALVIVLDDVHWMDAASLDLLESLTNLVARNPILVIGMLRPDRDAASWAVLERIRGRMDGRFQQLSLEPLPAQKASILIENLLGMQELPDELRRRILDKAEGNPFFVEEMIRSLIEAKQITRDGSRWRVSGKLSEITLPNTLAGVLGARIDRLPDQARYVLQIASVLGRSFDRGVLERVSHSGVPVPAQLEALMRAELIQAIGVQDPQYTFRHVLVQQAAYESILLRERRTLHRQAGGALEEMYATRIEEFAPVMAHHFHLAGDARSLKYDVIAGDVAARLFANTEAAIHYRRALETARSNGGSNEQIQELFPKLGGVLELAGRFEEALDTYEAMRAFGEETGTATVEIAALMAKATIYSIFSRIHNPVLSGRMLHQALEISQSIGDRAAQAKLNWNLMLSYLFSKRPDSALEHGKVALDLAREGDDPEQLAFVLNDLCRLYTCRGEFEQAVAAIREARALWRSLGNQVMLADSLGSEAEARFNGGEFDQAYQRTQEALQITTEIENGWGQSYDCMLMSFIELERGAMGHGIELAQRSLQLADDAGLIASSIGLRSELAWVYASCGALERGLPLIEQALAVAEEKQPAWKAFPQAAAVRMHLAQDDVRSAREVAGGRLLEPISIPYARYTIFVCLANIELAVKTGDRERGLALADDLLNEVRPLTRPDIPDVLRWKGEALLGLHRIEEAWRTLSEARSLAERLGANSQLWAILVSLSRANSELGDANEARADLDRACRIVEGIAASLDEVGLSEAFLGQPTVQALKG